MGRESIVTFFHSTKPFVLSHGFFPSLYDPGWLRHFMTTFSSLDSIPLQPL